MNRPINPLDYGTSPASVRRSPWRWKLALLVGGAAVLFAIAVIFTGLWQMRNSIYFPGNPAVKTIGDNGATCSDDPNDVRVFVVGMGGGEKQFGDAQLRAILPALSRIDHFHSLDLHGSSVTDAALGQLKSLSMLDAIDVSDTPVTLNGLLALKGMPRLSYITLGPGQLTASEMRMLNAGFPRTIKSFRGDQTPLVRTTGPSK